MRGFEQVYKTPFLSISMKLAVLFSGGKDSCFAMFKAMKENEIACLISIFSENKESYMFHVPNIWIVEKQAEAAGIPLLKFRTKGEKEAELEDLKKAFSEAKKRFKIEGIVTGAIMSAYQATRIQKLCKEIGLKCINPLWHKNQIELLEEMIKNKFKIIISGVFAYPLGKELLGTQINESVIKQLAELEKKYKINPAGEGGEIETTVLDCPFFRKKVEIIDSETEYENYSGVYRIKNAKLVEK